MPQIESLGHNKSELTAEKDIFKTSPGMRALNNLFEDAYSLGRTTVGDLQKYGPGMVNNMVDELKKDPRKGVEAAAVLGLTATAVAAESPAIIGLASVGAILGGIHLAGEACINEAKKLDTKVRKSH